MLSVIIISIGRGQSNSCKKKEERERRGPFKNVVWYTFSICDCQLTRHSAYAIQNKPIVAVGRVFSLIATVSCFLHLHTYATPF